VWQVLSAELDRAGARRGGRPVVLDVGGGSGVWAVPLAVAGARVTVVDASPNALAVLLRRATEAGCADRVTAVGGDADDLSAVRAELTGVPAGGADLVLAHGILEQVDRPAAVAAALAGALAPAGALSVLVANHYAAVLAAAVSGRPGAALELLTTVDPAGAASAAPPRRFDEPGIRRLLAGARLEVELVQGDGVIVGLLSGAAATEPSEDADILLGLERAAAEVPALRQVAARLHLVARRAGSE
jgi:SAM-dependent methyltransferase